MTKKQRVKQWVHFEGTDLVPWQINYTTSLGDILMESLGLPSGKGTLGADTVRRYGELDDFLGNHIAYIRNRGLRSVQQIRPDIWQDEWGVVWDRSIDRDIGAPLNCILASGNLLDLKVPDPDDPERYAHAQMILDANPERYVLAKFSYSLFERAWSLRGMQNLLVDLISEPQFVHELLRAICDFNLAVLRNLRAFPIDGVYFGDDWGSQKAMLMSPNVWRSQIKPYLKEMYDQAHRQGYDVFIHSCGDISAVLDDLVEIGVNVFNPFQPEVMDTGRVMRQYSSRLAFYGGLSIQRTLPFGTREEVRAEVRDRISMARAFGGLIVSPSHDMPPDVPVENVVAMRDALRDQIPPFDR